MYTLSKRQFTNGPQELFHKKANHSVISKTLCRYTIMETFRPKMNNDRSSMVQCNTSKYITKQSP